MDWRKLKKEGLPSSSDIKRICVQCRRPGFNLWVRKIPWRREGQSTLVFLPGELHGQRSLAGCNLWGHKELDITEWLLLLESISMPFVFSFIFLSFLPLTIIFIFMFILIQFNNIFQSFLLLFFSFLRQVQKSRCFLWLGGRSQSQFLQFFSLGVEMKTGVSGLCYKKSQESTQGKRHIRGALWTRRVTLHCIMRPVISATWPSYLRINVKT